MSAPATHARTREPWFRLPRRNRRTQVPQEAKTPVIADLGDGFEAAFEAANTRIAAKFAAKKGTAQAPAVRPLPVSPFEGASGAGLMPDLSDITLTDIPRRVLQPLPDVPAPDPEAAANAFETLNPVRPYAPANDASPAPSPVTLLRAVPMEGGVGAAREVLAGWPEASIGVRVTGTGHAAGLFVGTDGDVAIWIENASAEWWDEFISAAQRTRDMQAYGAFRPAQAADGGDAA